MSDSPIRCVVAVRSLPIESYKHPEDGQKWKQPAKNRRALLVELATYANPDGTFLRQIGNEVRNYSPSIERLQKAGYARASLYRMMDSLYDLGLLTWDRKRHYDRREYSILIPAVEKHVSDSSTKEPQTETKDATNQVSDSLQSGLRFDSEAGNQVSDSEKTGLIAGSTIRLLPPLESSAPSAKGKKKVGAVGYFLGQYKDKFGILPPIPPTEEEEKQIQDLENLHGKKKFGKVVRVWMNSRRLDGLSKVAMFFLQDFETYYESVYEPQNQMDPEFLRARQDEAARTLADSAQEKELATAEIF
jgi:hypothetical protein